MGLGLLRFGGGLGGSRFGGFALDHQAAALHIQVGVRAKDTGIDAVFQVLAALVIAAGDGSGNVLNVHILRITDDIGDLFAQAVAGAQLVGAEQAADAARRGNQHGHAVLDEPAPVVAALGQRIRQPEDAIRQGDQRADQQRNARHGQRRSGTGLFALLFGGLHSRLRRDAAAINGGVCVRVPAGGRSALVHAAELGLVNGSAVRSGRGAGGMGKLGCPLLGTLLKVGHLALFHQLIHDDKGDSDRPHPDAKRDDDGPPGELERLVCRAGPVGILVLVAAVTAAVGVAGVCVARPLILILHTMLLLQYFPFRQYRTILSADMACRSRRSGA